MTALTEIDIQQRQDKANLFAQIPKQISEMRDEKTLGNWFSRLPVATKLLVFFGSSQVIGVGLGGYLWVKLGEIGSNLPAASEGLAQIHFMQNLLVGLWVLWCLALIEGMRRVHADIARPIKDLLDAYGRISRQEREFEIRGLGRHDEFGELARTAESFRLARVVLDRFEREREEENRAAQEAHDAFEREREETRAKQARILLELADKFESTVGDVVGGVAAASSELQATASTMAAAADQSAKQTDEVTRAMEEASSGATAAAAASDEFAMSIKEISRQASTSAELARKASDSAKEADGTIVNLSESAEQVSQIVELIQSIAQRTNLLALNASIEAARGGEAGRGFAVVASEVKELANQTSKATEEVSDQVRNMQESTQASVAALREIGQQIKQLEGTAVSIASAVDQQSVAGQDLARSIDLAARSTDKVSSNVEQVREASQATGLAASQVLNSSGELEEQAKILRHQVSQFLAQIRNPE